MLAFIAIPIKTVLSSNSVQERFVLKRVALGFSQWNNLSINLANSIAISQERIHKNVSLQ